MASHDNLRLDNQLCLALHKATRAVVACYRPLLAEIGLTYSQYTVMLVLWEDGGEAPMGRLADALHLDSGTLSPLLKRLEGAGLVTRERGTDDERTLLVRLTADGMALEGPAGAVQRSVESATGLEVDHLARLRHELTALADHLRQHGRREKAATN